MISATVWLIFSSLIYTLRLDTGSSFPKPLTAEEERHYVALAAQGDLAARNVLIERNLRLVAHIMKKYYAHTSDQEDLISIGTIGLIKGISSFDPSKGARLATYAARCVENEILMYFRSQKKTAMDVSLSELIETGKDGNAPVPDPARAEHSGAALRPRRRPAPDPAGDRRQMRHQPLLCIPLPLL